MESEVSMFKDGNGLCWSTIVLEDGNHVCVSVSAESVIIKKGKSLLFGRKIYKVKGKDEMYDIFKAFSLLCPNSLTPAGMSNPVLQKISNAILHCSDISRVYKLFSDMIVE